MPGFAQSPPSAQPQPLPQAQFDALVEAVKKAVAEELKAQGAPAKPAVAGAPEAGNSDHRDALDLFGERLLKILAAAPELGAALADLPQALDESKVGGRSTGSFLLLLLSIAAAALVAEGLVRAALARPKRHLAAGAAPEGGVRSLASLGLLALLDLLPVVALRLVAQSSAGALFPLATLQQRLAFMVVTALVIWRVYAFILRLIVRPELPAARLCGVDDGEARLLYRRVIAVLLAIILLRQLERALVAIGTPEDAIVTARLFLGPLAGVALVWLVVGVNVTPLLAGASVLGLALSFGSQTLVKDIVSGIFYLTDDAVRVGEFIDCEKGKGTVESFTLRSVRLRNPNGQIHTIPFGELGHVTNFSRDWAAVEFPLRFARDVDLDRLRAATQKVSADIMLVPEMREKLLEPLKMQGIAEVADNALVVRFKFVARPGNPDWLQNETVTRILRAFPGLGIEFAK